jgi:hypothetical protein
LPRSSRGARQKYESFDSCYLLNVDGCQLLTQICFAVQK